MRRRAGLCGSTGLTGRLREAMSTWVLFSALRRYTYAEVTSQNLWPRYDRHFVGITQHNVWS